MGPAREQAVKIDKKTGRHNDKSLNRMTKIMLISTVALMVVGLIIFFCLAAAVANIINDRLNPIPEGYDRNGQIKIDTDKLTRTDPIVAIWQSHDAVFDNWPVITDNFLLVFYNDNTYAFYDRANSSFKKGTWTKKADVYTDNYTLSEGTLMSHSEMANGKPASGSFQLTLYEEGAPPHARISYIDYELVDYYPLQPDTIANLNNGS
jgi:hypothetical protein